MLHRADAGPSDAAALLSRLRALVGTEHDAMLALIDRLAAGPDAGELDRLRAENTALRAKIQALNLHATYEAWFNTTFHTRRPTPNTWPFTTFEIGTPWCDKVVYGMQDGEFLFAEHLIEQLDQAGIAGDIVEFGTAGGTWVKTLASIIERRQNGRRLWGFDSFQGLPEPDIERDGTTWHAGQYAASLAEVSDSVGAGQRPFLTLVEGWFQDSLVREPALGIETIAYARIDGDLYASAVECLKYLAPRLVDGAILVFDDWQFSLNHGETLAFREWIAEQPGLECEFLGMNMWAHLYLRVHRRG